MDNAVRIRGSLRDEDVQQSGIDGDVCLLSRDQRDGLLTAVWLLISDPVRTGAGAPRTLTLELSRPVGTYPRTANPGATTSIVITTSGVPRNGVDPAAWQAIRKVGRHVEAFSGSTLRLEITTVSDTTAELT